MKKIFAGLLAGLAAMVGIGGVEQKHFGGGLPRMGKGFQPRWNPQGRHSRYRGRNVRGAFGNPAARLEAIWTSMRQGIEVRNAFRAAQLARREACAAA